MPRRVLTPSRNGVLVPAVSGQVRKPSAGRPVPTLSRRRLLAGLGAALLLATPLPGQAQEPPLARFLADEIEVLFWNLNGVRNLYGLSHLHRSSRLDQSAFAHAADMAGTNSLSHTSSNGIDVFSRIKGYYPYDTWIGENLAMGYGSGLAVLAAWRASAAHNAILTQPEFNAVGLACVARDDSPAGWYWAADFGGVAE